MALQRLAIQFLHCAALNTLGARALNAITNMEVCSLAWALENTRRGQDGLGSSP